MTASHEQFLRQAIALAARAREKGNEPFGAVLVRDRVVVGEAENSVVVHRDPTRHAELNLIREACRSFASHELRDMTLYSSTEPCAMCAGAIYWAGIRHVVYALPAEGLAELASDSFVVPCRALFSHAEDPVKVEGPLLIDEAREVHSGFWTSVDRP